MSYNSVPPPEYYTDAEWEADHADSIEENLRLAELDEEIGDELASPRQGQVEEGNEDIAENDINEVD